MKTNKDKLVMQQVKGQIHHPSEKGYRVGYDGVGRILPSVGGITYNQHIGDKCMGLVGDHIEPCVSLQNKNERENTALQLFACVGNVAKVISGNGKGKEGIVTGTHGGIEHCFIDFSDEDVELLNTDDTIVIKAYGQGLELTDYPNISVTNLDPNTLEKMHIKENKKYLEVGVTHIIPAELMGSGLGVSHIKSGDYDIMTQDEKMNRKYGLNKLRFGDIVAINNHDSKFGPHYQSGSVTIGVIVHSDSYTSGHGPGVCVLMSGKNNSIKPFIDSKANLKYIFAK